MKDRNTSTIEFLRIILLLFLVFYHSGFIGHPSAYIDTRFFSTITGITVPCFAIITGLFVFRKQSLVFRNISRLLFIILISIIISFPMKVIPKMNSPGISKFIYSGSRDVGYLYAIIPLYILGPLFSKIIKRTNIYIVALIGSIFFITGLVGYDINSKNILPGFFFLHGPGIVFSFFWLFGLGIFGYIIKYVNNKYEKMTGYYLAFFIVSLGFLLGFQFGKVMGVNQGNPMTTLMAIGLIGICTQIKGHSKIINRISKRMYFVYEFHWYGQYLGVFLFPTFRHAHPHLQIYCATIFAYGLGTFISIIATEIQIRAGNKYIDPLLLLPILFIRKKINFFKTKT